MTSTQTTNYSRLVQIWLFTGVIMVAFQILLGGITRLTGSGLSITKWEVVTGTIPPLNAMEWHDAFDLYKETPQYQKINQGMSLREFKKIYFWEYVHRLWARSMGLVFVIPFLIFLIRGMLDKRLLKRLSIMIVLAAVVATFGWIMVASGLNERPWVNAYKLTIHLNLGLLLFGYVYWVFLYSRHGGKMDVKFGKQKKFLRWIFALFVFQLIVGGIMSGMKAGLYFPTWPDMNGEWVPRAVLQSVQWSLESFVQYDTRPLAPALVQLIHRTVAYVLFIIVAVWAVRIVRGTNANTQIKRGVMWLCLAIGVQVVLGILTVVNCVGSIPVVLGVLHQMGAMAVLIALVWLLFLAKAR